MTEAIDDLAELGRLTTALAPWRDQLVLVGGWAHRLHREHASAHAPSYAAVRTRDADLAFAANTQLHGQLNAALLQAGFTEHFSGDEHPPVAHYHLGEDDQGFYAEFLMPLVGSGRRRGGEDDVTETRGGIVAQKLRHLEPLLVAPWMIRGVQVANAVAFVVQKLLIHATRNPPRKRANDILYIHDTIQLFGAVLGTELRTLWDEQVARSLTARQRKEIPVLVDGIFGKVTDEVRRAAQIPRLQRTLRPEDVQEVCRAGLGQLLGL
ncbi:MAG TPA: GSU2403 family nucleotidyltransferase fold protein [Gemmatimonadales bacterium]|nr:GSU2403 family nucleotidyltransferase fold protein [Gemmatimonadales bacterium]